MLARDWGYISTYEMFQDDFCRDKEFILFQLEDSKDLFQSFKTSGEKKSSIKAESREAANSFRNTCAVVSCNGNATPSSSTP